MDHACVSLLLRHKADASRRGGPRGRTAEEEVPLDGAGRERVLRLLSAYTRGEPDRRTDPRFDLQQNVPPVMYYATNIGKLSTGDASSFDVLL
jgi:hypothetical protein